MKVSGHMPVLHATMSDTKYKSLMKLIDVAIPKFGGDEEAPNQQGQGQGDLAGRSKRPRLLSTASSRSHQILRERRPSANLFLSQQTAIILDDESDADSDEFEDAADGSSANQQLKVQQRTFEFKFAVDRLQGSLAEA